jgi:YD repeat-containing protein
MSDLAAEVGVGSSYFTRILRLSFLSPDIVATFLNDGHPLEMTAKQLADGTQIPVNWDEQRKLLEIT